MTLEHLQVKAASCPGCGKVLDGATSERGAVPEEGALTVCIYCCTVAVFTADLDMRLPLPGELEELPEKLRAKLDHYRSTVLQAQRQQRIMDRLVFVKDEAIAPDLEEKIRSGLAALVGPLCSDGPPPRRMRPATRRRCVECRRPVFLATGAPATSLVLCAGCAVDVLDAQTRGGA